MAKFYVREASRQVDSTGKIVHEPAGYKGTLCRGAAQRTALFLACLTLSGCGFFGSYDQAQQNTGYRAWVADYSINNPAGDPLAVAPTGAPLSSNQTNSNLANNTAGYQTAPLNAGNTGQPLAVNNQPLQSTTYNPNQPLQSTTYNPNQPLQNANYNPNQPLQSTAYNPNQSTNNQVIVEPITTVEPINSGYTPNNTPQPFTSNVNSSNQTVSPATTAPNVPATTASSAPSSPDIVNTGASNTVGNWQWPVDGGQLTRAYNPGATGSKGALIGGQIGATVRATNDGEVVYVGYDLPGLGNLIIISHANNIASGYGHVGSITVSEGDSVSQGQAIAKLEGINTQESVVHFEIRENNNAVNPITYVRNP